MNIWNGWVKVALIYIYGFLCCGAVRCGLTNFEINWDTMMLASGSSNGEGGGG